MKRSMFFLDQKDMPTKWYNVLADMPEPLPPYYHPMTKQPLGPEDLADDPVRHASSPRSS